MLTQQRLCTPQAGMIGVNKVFPAPAGINRWNGSI
ncbi:hypothetical protein SEEN176_17201 [Salmonella enterica subsp. enterica serovar Newport str. CVM 4176]|nr:hypothetical protein SEEN176_17201 [Salmonella enterica subsp. enterica serovar Newport str. CVM 4176]